MEKVPLDLRSVNEYLIETNAIDEAESLLLKSVLDKSKDTENYKRARFKNEMDKESKNLDNKSFTTVSNKLKQKEIDFNIDSVKIADLLESFEKKTIVKEENEKDSAKEANERRYQSLKDFEVYALEELMQIEKKKDWMQLKLLEKKKEIEKLDMLKKKKKTENNDKESQSDLIKKNDILKNQNIEKIYQLSEDHAKRMAQTKSDKLSIVMELESLRQGNWNKDNSFLTNQNRLKDTKNQVDETETSHTDDIIRKNRIESLLGFYSDQSSLDSQKQKIMELRNQMEKDKQSLDSEPIFQLNRENYKDILSKSTTAENNDSIEGSIVNNPNDNPRLNAEHSVSQKKAYKIKQHPTLKIDKNIRPHEFLEKWLNESESNEDNSNSKELQQENQSHAQVSSPKMVDTSMEDNKAKQLSNVSIDKPRYAEASPNIKSNIDKENYDVNNENVYDIIKNLMKENEQLKSSNNTDLSQRHKENYPIEDSIQYGSKQQQKQYQHQPQQQPWNNNIGQSQPMSRIRENGLQKYIQFNHQTPFQGPFSNNHSQQNPYALQNPSSEWMGTPVMNPMGPYAWPQSQSFSHPGPSMMPPPQNDMLRQMQQIAQQIESENEKLMGHIQGEGKGQREERFSLNKRPDMNERDWASGVDAGRDYDKITYPLERDKVKQLGSNEPKKSPEELKEQKEIRMIQYQIEKLKYQQQLDDFKTEYERQKSLRERDIEQEKWLMEQKRELQAIKMKQVLVKERKILKLQEDELDDGPNDRRIESDYGGSPRPKASEDYQFSRIRELAGVGNKPKLLDYANGISVILDGAVVSSQLKDGDIFRIALGVYDAKGNSLVRITASEWKPWVSSLSTVEDFVMLIEGQVIQSLMLDEFSESIKNAKALFEFQYKKDESSEQSTLGWSSFSLCNNSLDKIQILNGCWRIRMKKGISDPVSKPETLPKNSLIDSWFLFRVLDQQDLHTATNWSLASCNFTQLDSEIFQLYQNPWANHESMKIISNKSSSEIQAEQPNMPSSRTPNAQGRSSRELENGRPQSSVKNPPSSAKESLFSNFLNNANPSGKPASGVPTSSGSKRLSPLDNNNRPFSTNVQSLKKVPEVEEEDDENAMSSKINYIKEESSYWYLGNPLGPCTERYQRGDGVDFYIDCARFLPDNCTVTRMNLRIFGSNKEQVGTVHETISSPNSLAISPTFAYKAEFRGNGFDMTSTALIRIDTVDSVTLAPSSVGYACIKLFSSRDRKQPTSVNDPNAYIHTGCFQLPLYAGRIPNDLDEFDESMLSSLKKIPCSSLLIRIYPAPKSNDGISTLSRDEFPSEEWEKLGLSIPAPNYESGAYYGAWCEPKPTELIAFSSKEKGAVETVESSIVHAIAMNSSALEAKKIPPRPNATDFKNTMKWFKSLFPPFNELRRTIDYSMCVPYDLESGFCVSVDQIFNIPDSGIFGSNNKIYKVLISLSSPGLFYKDPPLYEGVYYTKQHDFEKSFRNPSFLDGYFEFNPSEMDKNLFLIFDIRTIKVEANNKDPTNPVITVEPPSLRKSYWSLLPISREKVPGHGFKYLVSGCFQIPLIEGPVPYDLIFKSGNPYNELIKNLETKEKSTGLKLFVGASLIIKIYNPLIVDLVSEDLNLQRSYIQSGFLSHLVDSALYGLTGATARVDKFKFEIEKFAKGGKKFGKSLQQMLPNASDTQSLLKTINKEFETKVNLS